MSTIKHLAFDIEASLKAALPHQRKTLCYQLSLAVAAVIETRTCNTAEIANAIPLKTENPEMRYQWFSRLLANEHVDPDEVMIPFAIQTLIEACQHGETIIFSIDQSSIEDRHSLLMISVRYGERALPVLWCGSKGVGNMGFDFYQETLLDKIRAIVPEGARVLLLGDRFYGTVNMIRYCQKHQWHYRLRLKSNLEVYTGSTSTKTGELAQKARKKYKHGLFIKEKICLTSLLVETYIGIVHEPGHKEAWIIAMDVSPTYYRVLEYGLRWPIESLFSDFKTRGFNLEQSKLIYPDRVSRLVLILSLGIYWAAEVGRKEALQNPSPLEKTAQQEPENDSVMRRAARRLLSWFKRGLRLLQYKAQCFARSQCSMKDLHKIYLKPCF